MWSMKGAQFSRQTQRRELICYQGLLMLMCLREIGLEASDPLFRICRKLMLERHAVLVACWTRIMGNSCARLTSHQSPKRTTTVEQSRENGSLISLRRPE